MAVVPDPNMAGPYFGANLHPNYVMGLSRRLGRSDLDVGWTKDRPYGGGDRRLLEINTNLSLSSPASRFMLVHTLSLSLLRIFLVFSPKHRKLHSAHKYITIVPIFLSPSFSAEIQPPECQINGGVGPVVIASSEAVASKRQRRPSVRLGDIGGGQPYDSHIRRSSKHWKISMDHRRDSNISGKSSKSRQLTNLSSGSGGGVFQETLDGDGKEGYLDSIKIGSWRIKDSKKKISMSAKTARSNWISSKLDEGGGIEGNEKYSSGEEAEEGFRDYDMESSGSPLKEQSPNNSLEHPATGVGHESEREMLHSKRPSRASISEKSNHNDAVELSDTDAINWRCREDITGNGVRIWLDGLGMSRYAPVFKIHEVDEEVLPLLTIEDLKDMGISAVGSRRKMYSAIQRLRKGFT